jgi:hypothetical protein
MTIYTPQGFDSSWSRPRNVSRPALRRPGSSHNEVRRNVDADRNSPTAGFEPAEKIKGPASRPVLRQGRTTRRRSSASLPKVLELLKVERPQPQEPKAQEPRVREIEPLASKEPADVLDVRARMAKGYEENCRRKYVRARVG